MNEPSHADIIQRISVVETKVKAMESNQHEIRDDVKAIRSAVDEGKGGWKVAMVLGIPAAIGAAVVYGVQQLFGK